MDAKLIARREFTSGGKAYGPGDEVDEAVLEMWPEGALENRIKSGFVEYVPVPRDAEAEQTELAFLRGEVERLTAELAAAQPKGKKAEEAAKPDAPPAAEK